MNFEDINDFPTLFGLPDTYEVFGFSGITKEDKVAFVTKNLPVAKKVGAAFSLNPLVILSQASIESGWGTSYMAKNIFNFFGVTAYGQTNTYWTGEKYISKTSGLPFRKYADAQAGFSDFARLITSKYKTAAQNAGKIEDYAKEIAYSPYISEKNGDNREAYRQGIINNARQIAAIVTGKPLPETKTVKTTPTPPVTKTQNVPLQPVPPVAELENQTNKKAGAGILALSALGLLALAFSSNNKNKTT